MRLCEGCQPDDSLGCGGPCRSIATYRSAIAMLEKLPQSQAKCSKPPCGSVQKQRGKQCKPVTFWPSNSIRRALTDWAVVFLHFVQFEKQFKDLRVEPVEKELFKSLGNLRRHGARRFANWNLRLQIGLELELPFVDWSLVQTA